MTTNSKFSLGQAGWEALFFAWVGLDILLLLPMTVLLEGNFPLLTLVWLAVPLIAVLRSRDPARVGFGPIAWGSFARTAAAAFGLFALLMLLVEPWAHVYRVLVETALAAPTPDTTFAWVARYPGWVGLLGMGLFTALISIFAEELFFRGWLLRVMLRRMSRWPTILVQAALFALPQALAAFIFPPLQAALWIVIYAWLGVGVIGGWAAARTGSIWPSLVSATLMNLILVAMLG
jgi:membrane protease YdiL (CAAX protease family)